MSKVSRMRYQLLLLFILCQSTLSMGQNYGIVRKNYFSVEYDSLLNMPVERLDSSTIRIGALNPWSGQVSNIGTHEYTLPVNFTGAAINPYLNHYYIGSGFNFLTFDLSSGDLIQMVPVSGAFSGTAIQNFRFNPADSAIYGMLPVQFYSAYFDSILNQQIEKLDSTQIRFVSINPINGNYTLLGNTSYKDLYTLAGNSIDPHQMLYYYSAVDTLVAIDIYTGQKYRETGIQLPANAIFENIAYSCADTALYGLTRFNHFRTVYDSLLLDSVQTIDSVSFYLSKADPLTGVISFISQNNLGTGGNLTGGAFIDPNSMTYFFNNGNEIVGISLITGIVNSAALTTFQDSAFALNMMRSTLNCLGAARIRSKPLNILAENIVPQNILKLYPNPAHSSINLETDYPAIYAEITDITGQVILTFKTKTLNISELASGIYFVRVYSETGLIVTEKLIKN